MKKKLKISLFFRWYDLWMGLYIDTHNKAIYFCPLPMAGIKFQIAAVYDEGTDQGLQKG